jgi:hypothetical protein
MEYYIFGGLCDLKALIGRSPCTPSGTALILIYNNLFIFDCSISQLPVKNGKYATPSVPKRMTFYLIWHVCMCM